VTKKARTGDKEMVEQRDLFQRVKDWLEAEKQVRDMELSKRELELLKPMFLLTIKPVLYLANLPDEAFENGQDGTQHEGYQRVAAFAATRGSEALGIAGRLEAELADLDDEERQMFMEELGIQERGLARLIRAAFHLLGLRTFFTAGEKEIKAWTFQAGSKGPQAAAVIHTDFEKKFIRAQIYSLEDLEAFKKESEIKAAGKLRVEGKDYEMQDGDIVLFLIGG
jgi:GTP-binding protein YchF